MDIELAKLETAVRVAYRDWSSDPSNLILIKSLRKVLDEYQGGVIDRLVPPWARGPYGDW